MFLVELLGQNNLSNRLQYQLLSLDILAKLKFRYKAIYYISIFNIVEHMCTPHVNVEV